MQPPQALRRLWLLTRLFYFIFGVGFIGLSSWGIASSAHPDLWVCALLPLGATCILCALLTTPANRARILRPMVRLDGRGSEEEAAEIRI